MKSISNLITFSHIPRKSYINHDWWLYCSQKLWTLISLSAYWFTCFLFHKHLTILVQLEWNGFLTKMFSIPQWAWSLGSEKRRALLSTNFGEIPFQPFHELRQLEYRLHSQVHYRQHLQYTTSYELLVRYFSLTVHRQSISMLSDGNSYL